MVMVIFGLLGFTPGAHAQPSDGNAEDVSLAAEVRATTVAAIGAPEDRRAYAAAASEQARRQAFLMAIARYVATNVEPPVVSQPRDASTARAKSKFGRFLRMGVPDAPNGLSAATTVSPDAYEKAAQARRLALSRLVARQLGTDVSLAFMNAPPREQTQIALEASRHWASEATWPNRLLVYMSDASDSGGVPKAIRDVLGDHSREVQEWNSHTGIRWRGEALRKALLQQIEDGLTYVRGGALPGWLGETAGRSQIDVPTPSATRPTGPAGAREKFAAMRRDQEKRLSDQRGAREVGSAFGANALNGYLKDTEEQRYQMAVLAGLYSIAELVGLMQP